MILITTSTDIVYAANIVMSHVKLWVDNNCLKINTTTTKVICLTDVRGPLLTSVKLLIGHEEFKLLYSTKPLGTILQT